MQQQPGAGVGHQHDPAHANYAGQLQVAGQYAGQPQAIGQYAPQPPSMGIDSQVMIYAGTESQEAMSHGYANYPGQPPVTGVGYPNVANPAYSSNAYPQGYNSQGPQGYNSQGLQGYNSQGPQGYNSQGDNSQGYNSQGYPQGYAPAYPGGPLVPQAKKFKSMENPLDLGPDNELEEADGFKPITEVSLPLWVSVVFTITGIANILDWIHEQREKRADETYQNPNIEVYEFVSSLGFEVSVAVAIVMNCILIGWEASIPDGELAGLFDACEHLFTIFFFLEWCLRIVAYGVVWIFEAMNFADTALVFGTGVLIKWVAEPMGTDFGALRIFTTLRALRLARFARALRLMPAFKEMWILIHGLTTSAVPLLWTLVIGFCVLYVFAIAATEFIGRSPSFEDHEEAQAMFGNFYRSMFTMVQLITMDTYGDLVIRPMMKVEPWLALFFVFFITVGVFIVMNLVTAIIVENAFAIVREDTESQAKEIENKKKKELQMLSDLFMEIDLDGSGELSKDELFSSMKNKKVMQMLDILEMQVGELQETWEILDDGDGLLTIKEFTDGIRRMKGEAKAKDIADVIKKLRITDRKHLELQEQAARYSDTLHALEKDAAEMANDTDQVVTLFKEMYHRLDNYIQKGQKEDRQRVREQDKLAKLAAAADEDEDEEEESEYEEEEPEDDAL